jgi:hypothetical protein
MRVDCGQIDPGAVIRPESGEWHPRMPDRPPCCIQSRRQSLRL